MDRIAPGRTFLHHNSGADLKGLFLDAIYWRSRHHYDIICIMGGICNVTTRSKTTRITTLRTMDTDTAIINYVYEMNKGLDSLNAQYPDQVTIMIPIVGVDLSKYSGILGQSVEKSTLNHTITAINAKITDCNNSRNLPTPNVANIIHRCKGKGTWSHRYKYLSDGCHFTGLVKEHYVVNIRKTIDVKLATVN